MWESVGVHQPNTETMAVCYSSLERDYHYFWIIPQVMVLYVVVFICDIIFFCGTVHLAGHFPSQKQSRKSVACVWHVRGKMKIWMK